MIRGILILFFVAITLSVSAQDNPKEIFAMAVGKIQPMQIYSEDVKENSQARMQVLQIPHRPDLKEEDFSLQKTSDYSRYFTFLRLSVTLNLSS